MLSLYKTNGCISYFLYKIISKKDVYLFLSISVIKDKKFRFGAKVFQISTKAHSLRFKSESQFLFTDQIVKWGDCQVDPFVGTLQLLCFSTLIYWVLLGFQHIFKEIFVSMILVFRHFPKKYSFVSYSFFK